MILRSLSSLIDEYEMAPLRRSHNFSFLIDLLHLVGHHLLRLGGCALSGLMTWRKALDFFGFIFSVIIQDIFLVLIVYSSLIA